MTIDMKLFDEIKKIVEEHDRSCSCCGPTDNDKLTKEIIDLIRGRLETK